MSPRRAWTLAEEARLRALCRDRDLSWAEIAAELGRTARSAETRAARMHLPPRRLRAATTDPDQRAVAARYAELARQAHLVAAQTYRPELEREAARHCATVLERLAAATYNP